MKAGIITAAMALLTAVGAWGQSGKCGPSATWSLAGNTLTISGSGSFDHYGAESYDPYSSSIEHVVIQDGITEIGDCAFDGYDHLESISIPNSVTSIGYSALCGCSSLKELTIPNSVTQMKALAVWKLDNLVSLTVPDVAPQKSNAAPADCFSLAGSSKLQTVKGNTTTQPTYLAQDLPPALRKQMADKSFRLYAEDKVKSQLEQWAKKGEFETTEQWKQRVNASTTEVQANKLLAQAKEAFLKEKAPKTLSGTLEAYDADQGAFPVKLTDGTTIYVGVPLNEASAFKAKWEQVKMRPQYGIVNDGIAILSCSFDLAGKTYSLLENYQEDASQDMAFDFSSLNIDWGETSPGQDGRRNRKPSAPTPIDRSVDTNIPATTAKAENTFAVIIGNENYQRVAQVQYAANDAATFAAYCQKTLGIPQKNIRGYKDATYGTMLAALKDLQEIAKAYKGNIDVIFYYAGHGIPSESDLSAYLLPVDADGTQVEACLSTKKLYNTLNGLGARQVVVLMDACFSGAQRGEGMLASARGVALKVKDDVPQGNMVVFTAANGQQTAYPYQEKGHGMFTYFLLKKLQDTKGDVTLGDLVDYVSEQVARQSVVVNKHSQTPTVIPATELSGSWRNLKLQ